jgi:prepilin-type N-terminal cleavage/methylation domain-containing protein
MMFRMLDDRQSNPTGFTLIEVVVVVALIGIAAFGSINGILFILQRDRAQSVASELAGWLTAVRRAGERGSGCSVTIAVSSGLAPNATLATTSPQPDRTVPAGWTNPCGPAALVPPTGPGATFRVASDPVTTFEFTPRGTVFVPGGNNTPIEISINSVQGGTARPPMRCVRITPPLGLIEVVNNGGATAGRCNP